MALPQKFDCDGSVQFRLVCILYKKHLAFWISNAPKWKMIQPFDFNLSNPHVSASKIIGKILPISIRHVHNIGYIALSVGIRDKFSKGDSNSGKN